MPIYVLLALSAALCFSLGGVLAKVASKYAIKNKYALLFYFYLTGLLLTPSVFALDKISNPLPAINFIFPFCLAFFAGNFFIYTVLFKYDISILQPFFHFQTIFSVLFAFLFLGEIFPPSTYLWILLIIIGGFLVGMNERLSLDAIFSKKFLIFLAGIFFYALSDIFAKKTMSTLNFYNLKFWGNIILSIMALTFIPLAKKEIRISTKQYLPIFVSGIFGFTAHLFFFNALSCNITISQPLAMFGSLFTFLISAVLSRIRPEFLEYHPLRIYTLRGIGILLMLSAAIMISLS